MAITTNNSTSVKPFGKFRLLFFTVIRLHEGASKNASDPKSDYPNKTTRSKPRGLLKSRTPGFQPS
jgi:hypothetical protein